MAQQKKNDNTLLMTPNEIDYILDTLKPESLDILGGEPTMSPYFKEIVDLCVSKNVLPWVFTNMTCIDIDLAKFLKDRGAYITGKLNVGNPLDPVQKKLQARLIGRNETCVDRMIEGLDNLRSAGYKMPMLSLENLLRKDNVGYAAEYTRWCLEREIRPDLEILSCATCEPEKIREYFELVPTKVQLKEVVVQLQAIYDEFKINWPILPPHISGGGICKFKDNGIYFLKKEGFVYMQPCSSNKTDLGKFTGPESITRALENDVMIARRTLKDAYKKNKITGPCGKCDYFIEKDCKGGCRATAENLEGKYGSYPICWIENGGNKNEK